MRYKVQTALEDMEAESAEVCREEFLRAPREVILIVEEADNGRIHEFVLLTPLREEGY